MAISAGAIRAGRAFVELFADDGRLVRGLRRAEKKIRAFGKSIRAFGLEMMGLGSAVLGPLVASRGTFYAFAVSTTALRSPFRPW